MPAYGLIQLFPFKRGMMALDGWRQAARGWTGVWERGGPRRGSAGALEKGETSSVGLEALGWDFAGTQGGFAGVCLAARFDGAQGLALELPAYGESVVFEQVCLGENVVVHLSNLDRAAPGDWLEGALKVGVASMKVFTLRGVQMGEAGLLAGVALTEDGFDGRAVGIVRTRGRRQAAGRAGAGSRMVPGDGRCGRRCVGRWFGQFSVVK